MVKFDAVVAAVPDKQRIDHQGLVKSFEPINVWKHLDEGFFDFVRFHFAIKSVCKHVNINGYAVTSLQCKGRSTDKIQVVERL